jgi:hypothetical protein
MLNPIKTPTQMMYEQANLPHYGGGGKTGVVEQFASRIQDAIRKYTKAVGHPPSAAEVKQLEDHIKSLSAPTGNPQQTLARTQQQTPFANQLVDQAGRPYPTATSPTGRAITPEQAKGVTTRETVGPFGGVPSQFDMTPVNMKARDYPKGQFQNAFPEDEFMSMANTGRASNRTWNKSVVPSTEDLASRQHTTEEALSGLGDEAGGGLGALRATEGDIPQMTSASAPFAERAAQMEAPTLDKLTDEMLMGKHGALVDKVVADFKARGIEPDQEDIVNAINAMINPLRHNYTGINPIGQRPVQRPGPASAEMNAWRDEARASGLPEDVVSQNPSHWNAKHQRDYLLDTEPTQRAPFAKDWQMEELMDKRRRQVEGKAEGGYMQSPRDMQAEMMVRGYDAGGQTRPLFGQDQPMTQREMGAEIMRNPPRYTDPFDRGVDAVYENYYRNQDRNQTSEMRPYTPSPRERLAELGTGFLKKHMTAPTARRVSANVFGGENSDLPLGFGAVDVAAMLHPAAMMATLPLQAADAGFSAGQGDYTGAILGAGLSGPATRAYGRGYNRIKQSFNK